MPASMRSFTDAAADAVARAIADVQIAAERDRQTRQAEHEARLSDLETRLAAVATLEEQLSQRLATLKDGEPGEPGKPGEPGAPGKLPQVRQWTDVVHYEGDVVAFEGRTFQALKDTGKAPGNDDWQCIAERGEDARTFEIRGTFSESSEYHALDVVALNGASFAAKIDNPGPCPGEGWQLIAAQGKRGNPGEPGKPGKPGEPGKPGLAVVAIDVDSDGMLTLINGDGSTVQCDLYDMLARIAK